MVREAVRVVVVEWVCGVFDWGVPGGFVAGVGAGRGWVGGGDCGCSY